MGRPLGMDLESLNNLKALGGLYSNAQNPSHYRDMLNELRLMSGQSLGTLSERAEEAKQQGLAKSARMAQERSLPGGVGHAGMMYGGAHDQNFGSLAEAQASYRADEDRKRALQDAEIQRNLQRQSLEAATSKNQRFQQAFGGDRLGNLMKLLMSRLQNQPY